MKVPVTGRHRGDSEDVIMSEVVLDISMSLDGLIAQPGDDRAPIYEFFFCGEARTLSGSAWSAARVGLSG